MAGTAPEKFAQWMTQHEHVDPRYGHVYRYHPRSDAHSVALCGFVLEDLVGECAEIREQGRAGEIVYGINVVHTWKRTRKKKTIDLAIGTAAEEVTGEAFAGVIRRGRMARVLFSCEAKTAMTEHSKSQPRIFDELGSSHEIVHRGDREAIAAGITIVNIGETFVSPLRQRSEKELHVSKHKQPHAARRMIEHLRGLPIRKSVRQRGFDAYATIVVSCDNQEPATLWTEAPAPQPGDPDHYDTFLERISTAYTDRFAKER